MEPNQTNAPVSPVEPVAPVEPSAPAEPAAPVASDGEKKTSKGMVVGMIILAIVAVAGIAFGVYELMQGSEKDSEIADLKTQVTNCANAGNNTSENDEPTTVTCPDGTEVEVEEVVLNNPVIKSVDSDIYMVNYSTNVYSFNAENKNATLSISVQNGQVSRCSYSNNVGDCSISGLEGKIYKIVTIYEGNGSGGEKIGFLMEDGSVWYSRLYNEVDGNVEWKDEFVVKKVNIDGFVKDIIPIGVSNPEYLSGYGSTIFVLNNNELVKYNESMFD